MIKFIKKDFRSVRAAINILSSNRIPLGIIILYYIIVAPICFLLYPFVKVWSILYLRRIYKELRDEA